MKDLGRMWLGSVSLLVVMVSAGPVAGQQVGIKTQFEGDAASVLSSDEVVVIVDAPGLPSKAATDLVGASVDVAKTLGLLPVAQDRVASTVKAKGRVPSGEAEARSVAEFLGAGRALLVRASADGKDLRLDVLGVNIRTGVSTQEFRIATKASLASQCRAVVAEVLAAIAVLPAPPPPAPEPVVVPPPTPAPVIAPPPPPLVQTPPPVVAEALPPPKPRKSSVARGAAVFGVTFGAQAISMLLCYALYAEVENDGKQTEYMDWAIGYSLVVPLISSAAGYGIASARSDYKYNYGSLMLGAYMGSAVAFGLGAAAHYGLGERPGDSPIFWPLTHVVLPLVLPAVGAAIFHKLGAKPKQDTEQDSAQNDPQVRRVSYYPPTVAVSRSANRGASVSLSLGTLSF